ncbi:MAG: hypothetical protein HWQ38_05330 [Nostoc sp. NMS7]|uniref:hypothetical protein n=1 Tax=Nostoc sp. NMS7 TaxID=2815391 RepID=UPI0025DD77A6|nr:hypothetical protein [Nostoc sp. NMS7]MBN3945927.1 hypothetical protein [Nostoc sp. NMS7]
MDTNVCHPDYYRIVERRDGEWFLKFGELFYSKLPFAVDMNDFELLYGISKQQVAVELFRLNSGQSGYYLADLRNKQYYYCGTEPEGVKLQLRSLGIGRDDPIE